MKHTIYKSLGYDKIGRGEWSVFDISDGRESRVGIIYPTEKELLRNLDNYAADYGCEEAQDGTRIRNAASKALAACYAVIDWAQTPGEHGGNPYCLTMVKLAGAAIERATGVNPAT